MKYLQEIKKLREETSASFTECKKAIEKAKGDIKLAREFLKSFQNIAFQEKGERQAKTGIISAYLHSNKKIGVLVKIFCETDFVANSKEFQEFAHEISLQIAAMNPKFVKEEDIPDDIIERQKEIFKKEFEELKKPPKIISEIVNNKLEKFKSEVCLLSQNWIKDEKKTIKDLLKQVTAKFGEKIEIGDFVRFQI